MIPVRSISRERGQPYFERLTVDQYERMIAAGVFADAAPIELVDGFLIRKDRAETGKDIMSVGNRHRSTVQLLERWLHQILSNLRFFLSVQQPIRLPPWDEPEPDLAIIRGAVEDYFERVPGAGDVALVVEVADSSLDFDREDKLKRYAAAGVEHYWIIDLVSDRIEWHWEPDPSQGVFQKAKSFAREEMIQLPNNVGVSKAIAVNSLIAPRS
jgi:Uma2 family endonuclease